MTIVRKPSSRTSFRTFLVVQTAFLVAFAAAWLFLSTERRAEVVAWMTHRPVALDVSVTTTTPADIGPLYDDPEVVTDEELASVLKKTIPRFSRNHLRPNLVEHALRTWGNQIQFQNPDAISGPQMAEFLTDSVKYAQSWGNNTTPLLESVDDGIRVRWGKENSISVHHDHMLASLTEAGLHLDAPVHTTSRRLHLSNVLSESMRDFRLDERETEWSAMAFTLWLAPQKITSWREGQGRRVTFDMLADRLMRSRRNHGVCLGLHRVYSLMLLIRLNDQSGGELISQKTHDGILDYLRSVRDLATASQNADGSWPANWHDGAEAEAKADPKSPFSRVVIATGHHLEWFSIAPRELHPPHEQILKAADWLVKNVNETPQKEIDSNYTFYSHVGKALAMWRNTSPAEFWVEWRKDHPECETFDPADSPSEDTSHAAH